MFACLLYIILYSLRPSNFSRFNEGIRENCPGLGGGREVTCVK
jgi:hypothetical protein